MNTIKELKSVIVKKDLISKLKYKNEKQVPRVKSIILHIGCRNQDLKSTAKAVFALKTITGDKGRLTRSKKTNLRFNTKKKHTLWGHRGNKREKNEWILRYVNN